MAKHTTQKESAQIMMDAITNNFGETTIVKIDKEKYIHFKAELKVVEKLQSLLQAPKELFKNIWKAVKANKSNLDEEITSLEQNEKTYELLNNKASKLLSNIISAEFIEDLSLNKFEDCDFNIASSVTISNSMYKAKHVQAGAGLIQLVLSHPEKIKEIFEQKKPIISEEELSNLSDPKEVLDENIFFINREDKTVTAKFNAAALVQTLTSDFSESSPIIAKFMKAQDIYTISLEHLQLFIGSKISPLIFKSLGGNNPNAKLEPVTLYQDHLESKTESNCFFSIAIDVSDSMSSHMKVCKEKLNSILTQFVNKTSNWTISITKFNDNSFTKIFHSTESTIKDLNNHINKLSSSGYTNLLGTMREQLKIIQEQSKYGHYAFMVISDGADTEKKAKEEEAIEDTQKTLKSLNNFQMFTLELGTENKKFFEQLAKEGCTHINLKNISNLSEFMQYTEQLNCSTKIIEFLKESEKIYNLTAPSGKIAIGEAIDIGTQIRIGNEKYEIESPDEEESGVKLSGNYDEIN